MPKPRSNIHSPERTKRVRKNQLSDLIVYERIQITEAQAKELKKHVDKLITLAKKNTLASRRRALSKINNIKDKSGKPIIDKLFGSIAKRYAKRNGGYTRIVKLDNRKGDDAPIVIIELV